MELFRSFALGLVKVLNCLLKLLQEESEPQVRNSGRAGETIISQNLSSGYTALTSKIQQHKLAHLTLSRKTAYSGSCR